MRGFAKNQLCLPRRFATIFVTTLIVLPVSISCSRMQTTLHYKLTVVVDTPQGERSGSSVVELSGQRSFSIPGPEAGGTDINISYGEATPVRLANGRYLFATLHWPDQSFGPETMLFNTFNDRLPAISLKSGRSDESFMARFVALAALRDIRDIDLDNYPVIATFSDIRNPYSLKVAPAAELQTILPGHHIQRMSVQITDDPVSHQISFIIPWIRREGLGYLDPMVREHSNGDLPHYRYVDRSDFLWQGFGF